MDDQLCGFQTIFFRVFILNKIAIFEKKQSIFGYAFQYSNLIKKIFKMYILKMHILKQKNVSKLLDNSIEIRCEQYQNEMFLSS